MAKPKVSEVEVIIKAEVDSIDEDKRMVFGWAYVISEDGVEQVFDKSGEHVPMEQYEELEKAAYKFVLESRTGGDFHKRKGVSTMVESIVFTPEKIEKLGLPEDFPVGWWVGFKVHDDKTWGEVKKGRYKAFSVHGKGIKKEIS